MQMSDPAGASPPHPTRAILLGLEQPHTQAALRSYTEARVDVVGVATDPIRRLRASRYMREYHRAPTDDELLRLLDRLSPDGGTLIPFTDEFLVFASKHHEQLSRSFIVTTLPWDVLRPIVDQRQAYRTAREIGVATPVFWTPSGEAEMREVVAGLDLDNESYLLKTFWEAGPANLALNRYTLMAGTTREEIIANCLAIYERNGEFPMIAQVIPGGPEDCYGVVMLVDHQHRPAFAYVMRRLKLFKSSHGGHPGAQFTVGANTFCESVEDTEAVETTVRLVEAFKFTGPIVMEYRRDSRTGRLIMVKPDPRMTIATGLSRPLGIDLPMQTYRLYNGLPLAPVPAIKPGVRWFWLAGYLDALWTERSYKPVHREVVRALGKAHRIRTLAFWDWRDPLPFFLDTGSVFVKKALAAAKARRRQSPAKA